MQLIAMQSLTYAGEPVKPGDRFEASIEDARILKGLDKAIDAPEAKQPGQLQSKVFKADDKPPAFDAKRRRGRYHRTDMRAED